MKPAITACIGVFLYAVLNVVMEQKLSKYSTANLLIYFYLVMLSIAFLQLRAEKLVGQAIIAPHGSATVIVLLVGVAYFYADYFYLKAYNGGGSLLTITTIFIMFPVFASLIKYAWVRELPNPYQITAYIFAAAAILLTAKGN